VGADDSAGLAHIDGPAVAALRSLRGSGNVDLYARLVALYREASQSALAQLASALQVGDLAAAGAVCHKFSASTANAGALVFARELRSLERICAAGDRAHAQRLFDRLLAAHPVLLEGLSRIQLRASA